MTLTRRDVLRGASLLAGAAAFGPVIGRAGPAWGAAAIDVEACRARRRLVLVDLCGGNDGLNTVVPLDGTRRATYDKVRPTVGVAASGLYDLGYDRDEATGRLGLHPSLPTLGALWSAGRVAAVQGVDYPKHNFSHFVSADIWQSGSPDATPRSGWLGRHLDRTGIADGELRALALGDGLPLALTGEAQRGAQLLSLPPAYPDAGRAGAAAAHAAYGGFAGHPTSHPLRHRYGTVCGDVDHLVTSTAGMRIPAGTFPGPVSALLAARELLVADLGVEVVYVKIRNFDTHSDQLAVHARLLRHLDYALEAFFLGTYGSTPLTKDGAAIGELPYADRTLVMTYSEFGRRIGENGTGTDHGAAGPVLLVGPPPSVSGVRLVGGFHGAHPELGGTLAPEDNLAMTTDLRSVYQAVLQKWLSQASDATPDGGDPAFGAALDGLFAGA